MIISVASLLEIRFPCQIVLRIDLPGPMGIFFTYRAYARILYTYTYPSSRWRAHTHTHTYTHMYTRAHLGSGLCGDFQFLVCDLRKFRRLFTKSLIRIQHLTVNVKRSDFRLSRLNIVYSYIKEGKIHI